MLDVVRSGVVAHVGTFNANPVCAAAALAAVGELERNATENYAGLESAGEQLAAALRSGAAEGGLPLEVNRVGGAAHGFVSAKPVTEFSDAERADALAYRRFAAALLEEGVHVIPRGLLYVSTAHDLPDLELTKDAVRRAAAHVVKAGVAADGDGTETQ